MTEPRHDTHEMSLDEIRAAIDAMPADSVAPPPPVAEAILDTQFPQAVSCPSCGSIFVPGASSAGDEPVTMVDGDERGRK